MKYNHKNNKALEINKFITQIRCVFSLSTFDWYYLLSHNIEKILSNGSSEDAIKLYKSIKECPLYTRSSYMEVRTMIVIKLFNANMYKRINENADFVNLAFLTTLIDCLADTIADEFETDLVQNLLEGNTKEEKITSAMKFLARMKKQTKKALKGEGDGKEVIYDQGTSEIFSILSRYILEILVKHESITPYYKDLLVILDWSSDYMFLSHEYSLALHNMYNTFESDVSLLSVDEHLAQIGGGTNYPLVFFFVLLGKWADKDAKKILKDKKCLESLKEISIDFSKIHALGNGVKSYERELAEKDFSSWVWNYLYTKPNWEEIRQHINKYLSDDDSDKYFEIIMQNISKPDLMEYFMSEYSRIYKLIMEKSKGVLPTSYLTLLDIILKLELRSGKNEEKAQLEAFKKRL